jgi:hypothetical protein
MMQHDEDSEMQFMRGMRLSHLSLRNIYHYKLRISAEEERTLRLVLITTILLLASSAQAATLTVCPAGCDYTNPQAAVNAANPSDTIEIYSGNYDKMIMTKSLTIRGGHMEPGGAITKTSVESPSIDVLYTCGHSVSLDSRWLKIIEQRDDCPSGVVSEQGSSPEVAVAIGPQPTNPRFENSKRIIPSFQSEHTGPQDYELLYSDDFSSIQSGWPTVSSSPAIFKLGYKNGRYHITVLPPWEMAMSRPLKDRTFDDFVVEVVATQEDGPNDNDYGVILRRVDKDDFYRFIISGTGYFAFYKVKNGTGSAIIPWTESTAINTGNATNRIRVSCSGDLFAFFVNDVLLGDDRTYSDSSFKSGEIGIEVGTHSIGNVHVSFDNITVRSPPLGPIWRSQGYV